jgi:hypothetical protein
MLSAIPDFELFLIFKAVPQAYNRVYACSQSFHSQKTLHFPVQEPAIKGTVKIKPTAFYKVLAAGKRAGY